jgi:hypothetical protein
LQWHLTVFGLWSCFWRWVWSEMGQDIFCRIEWTLGFQPSIMILRVKEFQWPFHSSGWSQWRKRWALRVSVWLCEGVRVSPRKSARVRARVHKTVKETGTETTTVWEWPC